MVGYRRKHVSRLIDRAIFLHESTWPHTAHQTQNLLQKFGQETSDHPPYSPDLAPSSFQLSSHCFTRDEDIKPATITWLIQQGHALYVSGKDKLITCCDKYLKYLRGLKKKFITGFFSVFFWSNLAFNLVYYKLTF